ncbi:MAG: hypothetical protein CSYNP_02444 [Syntrophus sp. SKADARSKE-3]|nr:hypothetical protein [Syntrophus sp. SKADARSKE-3]
MQISAESRGERRGIGLPSQGIFLVIYLGMTSLTKIGKILFAFRLKPRYLLTTEWGAAGHWSSVSGDFSRHSPVDEITDKIGKILFAFRPKSRCLWTTEWRTARHRPSGSGEFSRHSPVDEITVKKRKNPIRLQTETQLTLDSRVGSSGASVFRLRGIFSSFTCG